MASCLSPVKEMEMESTTVPNWLELPREVTQNILKRVGVVDIVTSACLVCPLWWNICKDPLMWRTIHMNLPSTSRSDLAKILLYAIDRSCGQVEDVDIAGFCSYLQLESINQRISRVLKSANSSEVVEELPMSEETAEVLYSNNIIEIIGRSCPLLKSLRVGSTCNEDAFAISKTMPQLRHLKIFGGQLSQISEAGLVAILEGCPHLETLHLKEIPSMDLSESLEKWCRDHIKDFAFESVESYIEKYVQWLDDHDYFDDIDTHQFKNF